MFALRKKCFNGYYDRNMLSALGKIEGIVGRSILPRPRQAALVRTFRFAATGDPRSAASQPKRYWARETRSRTRTPFGHVTRGAVPAVAAAYLPDLGRELNEPAASHAEIAVAFRVCHKADEVGDGQPPRTGPVARTAHAAHYWADEIEVRGQSLLVLASERLAHRAGIFHQLVVIRHARDGGREAFIAKHPLQGGQVRVRPLPD